MSEPERAADRSPQRDTPIENLPEQPAGIVRAFGRILKRPESVSILAVLALFAAILYLSPEVVERLKSIDEWIRGFLISGFEDGENLKNELHAWMAVLCVAVAATIFVSLVMWAVNLLIARSLRREKMRLVSKIDSLAAQLGTATSDRARLTGELTQLNEQKKALTDERDSRDKKLEEVSAERDKAVGNSAQLENQNAALLAQRESQTKKLEEAAADRDKAIGNLTQLEAERDRIRLAFEAREGKLRQIIDETINATSRIKSRLFAPRKGPGKTLEVMHQTYYISKEFDGDVRQRWVLCAGSEPLHFWQAGVTASDDADSVDIFSDINYRVIGKTPGAEVAHLPSRNEPRSKAACIFFLPRIEPNDTREIEISYQWKGLFRRLFRQGWENFSDQLRNAHALQEYTVEIYLEPGTGGSLYCEETGIPLPGKTLEQIVSHHGWYGWRYSARDIPAELLQSEIVLQCRWRKN